MASLRSQRKFAICVAVGCATILKPALDFLAGGRDGAASTRISVDAAVILLVLTTVAAYLACVTVCVGVRLRLEDSLRLTTPALIPAYTLALLSGSALVVFLFLHAGK